MNNKELDMTTFREKVNHESQITNDKQTTKYRKVNHKSRIKNDEYQITMYDIKDT